MKIKKTQSALREDWMAALPPVLLDRAKLCAAERKVPLELPVMVGLAAIATSVGPGAEVRSGQNRATRANLYVLLGVGSGIGKSEVFRDMLGPLMDFEHALHTWWEDQPSVKARAGEELLKARVTNIRACIRKFPAANSIELFQALQATERKRTVCRDYLSPPCLLADDSTSEALARMMARSQESIATVSADARYFLKRLGTPDTKEESFYLKAFSGDLALTDRVSRNSVRLRRPCLTALLLTQRDAYGRFVEKSVMNRSGLLPRFLHAPLKHTEVQTPKVDGRRVSRIRNAYAESLKGILEAFRFEQTPTSVEPTAEAIRSMSELESDCRIAAMADESIRGEVLRRRAEQTWRVALCLHLARHGNASALHSLEFKDTETAAAIVENFTRVAAQ